MLRTVALQPGVGGEAVFDQALAQTTRVTQSHSFSIIVPTYQRREMVCEAVNALARLEYDGPLEIIVVVDGSTDGTASALAGLNCPFRLKVLEQANQGQAAARNRGAEVATGEILLFLDDDMICEPDLVQQHARAYADGADVVTGEVPIHPESAKSLTTDVLTRAASWPRGGKASPFDVYSGHLSIRRKVFREVAGFDEVLFAGGYGGEDLDLGLRLFGRYDVRHCAAAIAWQKNLIGPSAHMRRARRVAAADLRVMAKHPQVKTELLAHRGAPMRGKMPLSFQLSRVPVLAPVAAAAATWLAMLAAGTRFHANPLLARIYFTARSVSYWAAFQTAAGKVIVRDRGRGN
ncbi:MAG: glycosyltransferase family 2 protein [Pseudomonadota bacterium]